MTRRSVSLWVLPLAVSLVGCGRSEPVQRSREAAKKYELRGEVMRMNGQTRTVVLKHEKIEGWMEPMTMEFPVENEAEFKKLQTGDQIRATVFVKDLDYWIGDIEQQPKR